MTTHKFHPAKSAEEAEFIAKCLNNLPADVYGPFGTDGEYVTLTTVKKTLPLYRWERLTILIKGILLTRQ